MNGYEIMGANRVSHTYLGKDDAFMDDLLVYVIGVFAVVAIVGGGIGALLWRSNRLAGFIAGAATGIVALSSTANPDYDLKRRP